tara:strand:- start:2858 stop:3283 length:426 start_codon:yes stop_codon:yes gene_type:complete
MNKDNYIINSLSNNIKIFDENNYLNKPNLVPENVKNFINIQLKKCSQKRFLENSFFYNSLLFFIFFLFLSIILIFKFKGFKNKEEIYKKNLQDKQYIMSKLIYYNRQNIDNNNRINNNLITDLPDYTNHPEASLLHRKIYF